MNRGVIFCAAVLLATDAAAQQLPPFCHQPSSDSYNQCLKSEMASRNPHYDLCVFMLKDYIEEFQKWRSCQLEELTAKHSEAVRMVIERADNRIRIINELMYCIANGTRKNPACPF